MFENALPRDAALYNEFHALIVHAGKNFCRARNPRCGECALHTLLPDRGAEQSCNDFMSLQPRHRWSLAVGGVFLALLLGAVFTFGSLDVPFEPGNWRAVISLTAVSSFIIAALMIFGLIFVRTIVRLRMERSKKALGARFKTKMVVGAMALSLLPGRVHVLRQLFAAESHAGAMVSAAAGNCVGTDAGVDVGLRPDDPAAIAESGAASWSDARHRNPPKMF